MSLNNISTAGITYSSQSNQPSFIAGGNFTNWNSTNQTGSGEGNVWSRHCSDWKEAQHALFQLGNLCMIISFLTPSGFRYHIFFLRFMLNIGFIFSIIWAGLFICMMDILIWNFVFFTLNSAHVIYLGYRMFPVRFNKTLEEVYAKMFKPLKVNRKQFQDLSQFANILLLAKGSVYAKEGSSKIGQKLSVLIKGRLKVTYDGLYLHSVMCNQFIDSPEYDAFLHHGNGNSTFQITISATEDSLLVSWPYRRLQAFLNADPAFAHVFRQMISKDISQKLYLIQEMLMTNPNYMQTLASHHSSMVNLRNSIVSSSNVNVSKLNCFGVNVNVVKLANRFLDLGHEEKEALEDEAQEYISSPSQELPPLGEHSLEEYWKVVSNHTNPATGELKLELPCRLSVVVLSLQHFNADTKTTFSILCKIQIDSWVNLDQ